MQSQIACSWLVTSRARQGDKDALTVGLVGLLWEMALSDSPELISVLFALLAIRGVAPPARTPGFKVICLVGLLWETIFTDSRKLVTACGQQQETAVDDAVPNPGGMLSR